MRVAGRFLPLAAMFTKRAIDVGEELTFDYGDASGQNSASEISLGSTVCLCGSSQSVSASLSGSLTDVASSAVEVYFRSILRCSGLRRPLWNVIREMQCECSAYSRDANRFRRPDQSTAWTFSAFGGGSRS